MSDVATTRESDGITSYANNCPSGPTREECVDATGGDAKDASHLLVPECVMEYCSLPEIDGLENESTSKSSDGLPTFAPACVGLAMFLCTPGCCVLCAPAVSYSTEE